MYNNAFADLHRSSHSTFCVEVHCTMRSQSQDMAQLPTKEHRRLAGVDAHSVVNMQVKNVSMLGTS